jgi:DMSO reductase iron-sulfur subunit
VLYNTRTIMSVELFDPIDQKRPSQSIFPLRPDEPEYALLKDPVSESRNRYGEKIDLVELGEPPISLNINGVDEIGFNPNRNKQHAFHFTADNCIGCHACESACSEKNDLPPHLSFRSVGYVEGGSYPSYTRMNISMACNHCDDPVCLKGCPTRAYTKHSEYGAVIQDPDICFGCGYCTWVCPYNAPQLDPVQGHVEKCNMCVDRLEVGLKPACVSACLGNALNFGVVENTPENREQIDTRIPGFPDPAITQPNIRFEQTRSMPREMTRTDSMPVKYQRDDNSGHFKPTVDQKAGLDRHWNIKRLSSRENPLVLFTLSSQAAVGILFTLLLGQLLDIPAIVQLAASNAYIPLLAVGLGLIALGLLMSTIHLGKPMRFYRGFNNLRHSPVSREGLGVVIFMAALGLHALCSLPQNPWLQSWLNPSDGLVAVSRAMANGFGGLALTAGLIALYYMYRCYCIKARPFWNHWQTATAFVGNMLCLGALAIALVGLPATLLSHGDTGALIAVLSSVMALGIALEAIGLIGHARAMTGAEHEGAVSHYVQTSTFGKTYLTRNGLMAANLFAAIAIAVSAGSGFTPLGAMLVLCASIGLTALAGRALFYVLVTPTTMPGAFFWKNKSFEQHARDIGLANFPQVGVVPDAH